MAATACSDSATGSKTLVAEESVNTSIGIVVEPIENLTMTLDYWTIEKDDTIGLFGEENHVLLGPGYAPGRGHQRLRQRAGQPGGHTR